MLSGKIKTCLGPIICLAALLAQLLIPPVHQLHLLEGCIAFAGVDQKTELRLEATEPQPSHHSHHDPATCPFCQAALHCRFFTAPTISLFPIFALPVQRVSDSFFTSIVANPETLVSGPRAPPISL